MPSKATLESVAEAEVAVGNSESSIGLGVSWCCGVDRLQWRRLADAGGADPVEVCAEMAFEQAQHCRVAVINCGTSGGDGGSVLAVEALSQQAQGASAAAVARGDEQAGVANTASSGSVGQHPAHRCVVMQQGEADGRFELAWINGGVQFSGSAECAGLVVLRFAELVRLRRFRETAVGWRGTW